tara:strand:- start:6849 stop:8585 length:1737 start_codon:yes stop_codon:yes gene_type:complete
MELENLLALVDVIIDEKINSTQLPQGPKGSRGSRGFDGENGKDFSWAAFSSDIIDEVKKHSVSFAKLSDDEKESLKGTRGFRGQKGSRGDDGKAFAWLEHEFKIFSEIEKHSLTFEKLNDDQKLELRGEQGLKGLKGSPGLKGERGDNGKSFEWEDYQDIIFARINEHKLKFSDLTDDEKTELKGSRGLRGQKGTRGTDGVDGENFSWENSKEEISKLVSENKLKFDDLSDENKEELKGAQGLKGTKGLKGKDGVDGIDFNWDEHKDVILSRVDESKLTFSDLTEDEVCSLKGPRGLRGQKGKSGANGFSAYETWSLKNDGSELDFLKSLTGLNGTPGIKGLDGKRGTFGSDGRDGIDGEDAPLIVKVEIDKLGISRYRFIFHFDDGSKLKTNEIKLDAGSIIQQITSSSLAEVSVAIEDESVEITNKVKKINFVGDLVEATDDGDGNVTVTIDSPDTSSIILRNVDCDTTVYVGSAVRMTALGVAINAIADDIDNSNVLGFVELKTSTVKCDIRVTGITPENYTGLDVTKTQYLSDTVPGGIQTSIPSTTGHIRLKLGQPFSDKKMVFMKGEAVIRG